MWNEFKKFLLRGNVIDLAVGVIIGAAFNGIVGSLVKDIFTPFIGLLTVNADLIDHHYKVADADISYGNFLQTFVVFIITAIILFFVVKGINAMKRKEKETVPPPPAAPPADIVLLTEIRDLLKKNG